MSDLDSIYRVNKLLWCGFDENSRERLNRFRKAIFNRIGVVVKNGKENLDIPNKINNYGLRKLLRL